MVVTFFQPKEGFGRIKAVLGIVTVLAVLQIATGQGSREFLPGLPRALDQLPPSRLKRSLQALPPGAQAHALEVLSTFQFPENDCASLQADSSGGIFYICPGSAAGTATQPTPTTAAAAVPVNPFPASLVFHSRPGCTNVIFLNFSGENVANTQWNTDLGRSTIPALAFSTDTDYTTFSDAEQLAIRRIWQRVSEDYAPFNVDVTTERPSSFTIRTAHALITRTTDANGTANPDSSAGGVGYVNVFGASSYGRYRPAWIYHNNLSNQESSIGEAVSHEIGHNLGLSHDGKTDGTEYYSGHGTGWISWGTIMGAGYSRNVTQWCKGDYYLANNTEDDLAIIAGKLKYRADDHANSISGATGLVLSGGTNIVATTPETDPTNTKPWNKGIIETSTDVDVFSFQTGDGPVELNVTPWQVPQATTRGGNLDVSAALLDQNGQVLLTNNPATDTVAQLKTNLSAGTYYVAVSVSSAGLPFSSSPTGYTAYGSLGQYFINGYISGQNAWVIASTPVLGGSPDPVTGKFVVALYGSSNQAYVVETSPDLLQWVAAATNVTSAAGKFSWTDPGSGAGSHRFYRGRLP